MASGRIFVGKPLCRDEDWIKMTVNYTVDASNATTEVQRINPILRPLLVPFNRRIREAVHYRGMVAEKLRPQMSKMIEAQKTIEHETDDNDLDLSPEQHNLATWSLVSARRMTSLPV